MAVMVKEEIIVTRREIQIYSWSTFKVKLEIKVKLGCFLLQDISLFRIYPAQGLKPLILALYY